MSVAPDLAWQRQRIASVAAVAAVHALVLWWLVLSPPPEFLLDPRSALEVFDVPVEVPPPPAPAKPAARHERPREAPAPPNLKALPAPLVSPPPAVRLPVPPPIAAAPVAGTGSEASAGAAAVPGPGTGAGGAGNGTGGGGAGGGGGAVAGRAEWASGSIRDSDYPRAAAKANAQGTVIVRFTVDAAGRPGGCRVTRSSGNAELDSATCGLIERRFRYRPARDRDGRAVADVQGWKQDWWLER